MNAREELFSKLQDTLASLEKSPSFQLFRQLTELSLAREQQKQERRDEIARLESQHLYPFVSYEDTLEYGVLHYLKAQDTFEEMMDKGGLKLGRHQFLEDACRAQGFLTEGLEACIWLRKKANDSAPYDSSAVHWYDGAGTIINRICLLQQELNESSNIIREYMLE